MPEVYLPRNEILALMASAPSRIASVTGALDADVLRTAPAAGEWSPSAILAHIRACEDVWGACAVRILTEDRPAMRALSPRTWIRSTEYLDLEFRTSLQAFARQRAELVARLERAGPEEWQREAVVTGAGAGLVRTVYWYAHGLATHERSHVKQIARIANPATSTG